MDVQRLYIYSTLVLMLPFAGLVLPTLPAVISIPLATLYLSVVPGSLLWDILADGPRRFSVMAMHVLGLSWLFLLGVGIVLLFGFPIVGIDEPISHPYGPLVVTAGTFVLGVVSVRRWHRGAVPWFVTYRIPLPDTYLVVYSVSVFLVTAATIASGTSSLRLLFVTYLALAPLLALKTDDPSDHRFLLVVVSVAILGFISLVNVNLAGFDIILNFAFVSMVLEAGRPLFHWDYNFALLLPTQTLIPFYHFHFGSDLYWVYKVPLVLVFGVVFPIALYDLSGIILDRATDRLLTVFLFVYSSPFFLSVGIPKHMIAVVFLVLLMHLSVSEFVQERRQFRALHIAYGIAVAVSHYTTAWFLILVIAGGIILKVLFRREIPSRHSIGYVQPATYFVISLIGVYYFLQLGGGILIIVLIHQINIIEFLQQGPAAGQAVSAGSAGIGTLGITIRTVLTYVGIGLGLLVGFYRSMTGKVRGTVELAIWFAIAAMIPPFLQLFGASHINPRRIMFFSMLFALPFFVLAVYHLEALPRVTHHTVQIVVAVFIVTSFCFASGAVTHVAGEDDIRFFDFNPNPTAQDQAASNHLLTTKSQDSAFYGDQYLEPMLGIGYAGSGIGADQSLTPRNQRQQYLYPNDPQGSVTAEYNYIVLHTLNTAENAFFMPEEAGPQALSRATWISFTEPQYSELLHDSDRIYDNGDAGHHLFR